MPGLPLEDGLEDGRAFKLISVSLVSGRRRNIQRYGVEDLRLVVVGIFCGQRLHRLQVGLNALGVGSFVVIDIHNR